MRRLFLGLFFLLPFAYLACGDDDDAIGPKPDGGTIVEEGGTSDGTTDGGADVVDAGPPCAPPSDPTKGAICVYLSPETIDVDPNDPDFDGQGMLGVQVYSNENGTEDAGLLTDPIILPVQPDGGGPDGGPLLMTVKDTASMIRIDNLPTNVYLRAIFFDAAFIPNTLRAGWWLAGLDTTKEGLLGSKLSLILINPGQSKNVFFHLKALRKLSVTVTRAPGTNPVTGGNGQGQLTSLAIDSQNATSSAKGWGVANKACADVSGNSAALIQGIVYGNGPYWLTGILDDFDAGGAIPPGSLISTTGLVDGGIGLPAANELKYPATQYKITHTIQLNQQVPRFGQNFPDPVSCP